MENELVIVDTQSFSSEELANLDTQVDVLIERHKENRHEINRLVFEGVAALTAGNKLAQDINSQGKLKRFWKRFTGSNNQTQKEINDDLVKAQYAAQQTLEKLADQNLLTFELIAAVNNSLNSQIEEVNDKIIGIKSTLVTFFEKVRAEVVRLNRIEQNVNLLNWISSIRFQMYNGVKYRDMDDMTKIVCLAKDFYWITAGVWTTSDLLLLQSALEKIGLDPEAEINCEKFIQYVSKNNALYTHLLDDNAQFATENERIAFALKNHQSLSNAAAPYYEFILELLCNMRQLEYAKKIHEKLLAAKKLFLECKIAEALPLLEETACAGESEARYMLATIYSKGLAGEKKPEYAALLTDGTIAEENPDELKKRADNGDVFAQYEMAQYHLRAATEYLKQSTEQNYFLALYELGLMYYAGVGVEKDYAKAKEYFKRGADMGNGLSMAYLAYIYSESIQNKKLPITHGLNAKDFINALNEFNTILSEMLEVYNLYEKAEAKCKYLSDDDTFNTNKLLFRLKYLMQGVDCIKDGKVEYSIGSLYLAGTKRMPADRTAARAWYQKAADKGFADAQKWLKYNPY